MTIRVIELFAGIGAQAAALERLGLDHECIAVAEIDERAYRGYCAIHGDVPNLGDVTKIEHLPECDLLTYSSPCTSISMAGKREGMEEGSGTASSLLWEVGRLLDDYKERRCLPEVLLMENVDAILFKANMPEFQRWLDKLEGMGYSNSYQVLNAKDYGVPQNRRRCFMVSTLTKGRLVFPAPIPLKIRMKDLLEENVPESFYLDEKRLATFERHKKRQEENGRGFGYKPRDPNGDSERERVAASVTTSADRYVSTWIAESPKSDGQGEPGHGKDAKVEVIGDMNDPHIIEHHNRVYGTEGISPCMTAAMGGGGGNAPKILEEPADKVNPTKIISREIPNDRPFPREPRPHRMEADGGFHPLGDPHPGRRRGRGSPRLPRPPSSGAVDPRIRNRGFHRSRILGGRIAPDDGIRHQGIHLTEVQGR